MGVRDFLTFFFRLTPGGQTPQPILTQNGSNDVHSRKEYPLISMAPKSSKFRKFLDLENFSLDLAFNIRGPESEHPLFFIRAQ